MDKLTEKNPPCVFFDDKLSEYEELSNFVLPKGGDRGDCCKDVDFLRIDCWNVAKGISNQATEWKNEYVVERGKPL